MVWFSAPGRRPAYAVTTMGRWWQDQRQGDLTVDELRHDALRLTAWTAPLWVLVHLPSSPTVPPLAVQLAIEALHWAATWVLVPLCGVATAACAALALVDREMRATLPYAVLILLTVVMLRDIFRLWV